MMRSPATPAVATEGASAVGGAGIAPTVYVTLIVFGLPGIWAPEQLGSVVHTEMVITLVCVPAPSAEGSAGFTVAWPWVELVTTTFVTDETAGPVTTTR